VIALAVGSLAPARGQIFGEWPVRYGVTSSFWYDGRADNRDFPSNGVFPGNFAADPITAAIGGAAGFLESNPRRSAVPYPSQTYVGPVRNLTSAIRPTIFSRTPVFAVEAGCAVGQVAECLADSLVVRRERSVRIAHAKKRKNDGGQKSGISMILPKLSGYEAVWIQGCLDIESRDRHDEDPPNPHPAYARKLLRRPCACRIAVAR
jgi:hypothetical protein